MWIKLRPTQGSGHLLRQGCCLLLVLAFTFSNCDRPDKVRIKLTSRERALIDTLYTQRIKVLRPRWDSLCAAQHDSLLEIALDSIVRIRREEEARLRARIQLEQTQ